MCPDPADHIPPEEALRDIEAEVMAMLRRCDDVDPHVVSTYDTRQRIRRILAIIDRGLNR